jgi:hypothetical protein
VHFLIDRKVPFRVHGGGHSKDSVIDAPGVMIDFTRYKDITVDLASQTAKVQAGAIFSDVTNALWKKGYLTTIGSCNTVGYVGASLGGGVGATQGLFGLICDNIVSYRIMTGSDHKIVAASEEKHPELFWALHGAGHGLGVITEVTIKIYPKNVFGDEMVWVMKAVIPDDPATLLKVHELLFELQDENPANLASHLFFGCMPPTLRPGIRLLLHFFGSKTEFDSIVAQLLILNLVSHVVEPVFYPDLNNGGEALIRPGFHRFARGQGLRVPHQNIAKAWSNYKELVTEQPDAATSAISFACYGYQKVESLGTHDTAFPHRDIRCWM